MKTNNQILALILAASAFSTSHAEKAAVSGQSIDHPMIYHETLKCDREAGCEVICHQPGQRWDSYLKTAGDIEVTYFLHSGVRQLKADVGDGQYTVLDTHPELQSCRITGVID